MNMRPVVLMTDRAWPDDAIERQVLGAAGFELVCGPADPGPVSEIERTVREWDPVGIMTCWAEVSAGTIAAATNLKVVARMGVGLDNIDIDAATSRGVQVTNVPDYCVEEVSDHAVALILNWTRGISRLHAQVRSGCWNPAEARLRRTATLTVGLVGFGRIGRATARKLRGFGVRLLVADPVLDAGTAADSGAELACLEALLPASDVVVLHAPLLPSTHHLLGAGELSSMKTDALLVNVSRGGLLDTQALAEALTAGQLGGVALDVLEEEPAVDPRLLAHPNVTITPHVGFSSDQSVVELRTKAAEDVVRVLIGVPAHHPCNEPAGSSSAAAPIGKETE